MAEQATSERILHAALQSFAGRGYEATSLDALANSLGIRKQTILYWFPSKEALLDAVIDRAACDLASRLEQTLDRAGPGWERIEAIVKSVFRLGARQPELLGLVREVSRLGPPPATRLMNQLEPLVDRATGLLDGDRDGDRGRGDASPR
jgi:AcrR family transcriptional regulator